MSTYGRKHWLTILPGRFAVSRVDAKESLPAWVHGEFFSVTHTQNQLSVVCEQQFVPSHVESEPDWTVLEVEGPLEFSQVGVMASLTRPLAAEGVSVFVISTFDTDYLLIKKDRMVEATAILSKAGHSVSSQKQC